MAIKCCSLLFVLVLMISYRFHAGPTTLTASAFSIQALPSSITSNPTCFRSTSSSSELWATGMGMAKTSSSSTNKKKKKGGKNKKAGSPAKTTFDVGASLLRLEKQYEELLRTSSKAIHDDDDDDDDDDNETEQRHLTTICSEYVVAAKAPGYVADWVPVAQLCLERTPDQFGEGGVADPILTAAVSLYCRELSFAASVGSKVFQSVPRSALQYSVETSDSFNKHIYKPIVSGGSSSNGNDDDGTAMTKKEATEILEVQMTGDSEQDRKLAKAAYRKQSFANHPDRFIGEPESLAEVAAEKYHRIQLAYETLTSGVRGSWYEALGGRSRTDFRGPISLMSLSAAAEEMKTVKSAIVGLDPELVQTFAARSGSK